MRLTALTLAALALSAPALGQSGPEVRRVRPLPVPPELANEFRPGDRWARLRLDIDRRGAVTACRVVATNEVSRQMRYHFCRAFLLDYRTEPIMENGVAVPGTITELMVLPGRHRRGRR